MKTLKVRISEDPCGIVESEKEQKKYYQLTISQFFDLFLPPCYNYEYVSNTEKADICLLGTQHTNNQLLRSDEVNIFVTVENFSVGRTHYQHLNRYGRYDNPMVDLYIYNDIVMPAHNSIPSIYQRVRYFEKLSLNDGEKLYFDAIRNEYDKLNTPFEEKKFCLFISQNALNKNKHIALRMLSVMGKVDFLPDIAKKQKELQECSCYNSIPLLRLFNKYKFIVCFENSKTSGYITEKIFNVFLAKSIPIYDGSPDIDKFVNEKSFVSFDTQLMKKVKPLMNDKEAYNTVVNEHKVFPLNYREIDDIFRRVVDTKLMLN